MEQLEAPRTPAGLRGHGSPELGPSSTTYCSLWRVVSLCWVTQPTLWDVSRLRHELYQMLL